MNKPFVSAREILVDIHALLIAIKLGNTSAIDTFSTAIKMAFTQEPLEYNAAVNMVYDLVKVLNQEPEKEKPIEKNTATIYPPEYVTYAAHLAYARRVNDKLAYLESEIVSILSAIQTDKE